MSADAERTLQVSVTFPQGAYSGAEHGSAEELPSPARLHEAFVAAAAGGPWAQPDGRVLVALDEHRAAVQWLEDHDVRGVLVPDARLTVARARRFRWRGSPIAPAPTDFEPRAALNGPVVYVWPEAPDAVVSSLRTLAAEVTHLGRADSVVIIDVNTCQDVDGSMLGLVSGRGPGRVMRVPLRGRMDTLVRAHAEANMPGGHTAGSIGRQAPDVLVTGASESATTLCRFASENADWPFAEVWTLPIKTSTEEDLEQILFPPARVATAVGVHRAIVRAMESDIPPFVTGRDGDGPLRGAGHLAIHVVNDERHGGAAVLLAIPSDVLDADREQLLDALRRPLRARSLARKPVWFTVGRPTIGPAVPFWPGPTPVMRTATPLVLDAPGPPRQGSWTLEDAVLCSVGYAMRGVLERKGGAESRGIDWGSGWPFRAMLVERLRSEYQVRAIARRAQVSASGYVHRMSAGDLAVPVYAAVNLGRLAPMAGGFLALGRARHLGGGLLVPAVPR